MVIHQGYSIVCELQSKPLPRENIIIIQKLKILTEIRSEQEVSSLFLVVWGI